MTLHYCPNCEKVAFYWYLDEEQSANCQWYCGECHYCAEENENHKEVLCPHCGTEKSVIYLQANNEFFSYCLKCKNKVKAEPW